MAVASTSREATTAGHGTRRGAERTDEVPVLLRLPNLRPQRIDERHRPSRERETADVDLEQRNAAAEGRDETRTSRENVATGERIESRPQTAKSQVLGLLWRVGVVAAAIALIVMAYRIINGPPAPPQADAPAENENLSELIAPQLAATPEEVTDTDVSDTAPTIVTPEVNFPEATPLTESDLGEAATESEPVVLSGTHSDDSTSEFSPHFESTAPSGDELTNSGAINGSSSDSWANDDSNSSNWDSDSAANSWVSDRDNTVDDWRNDTQLDSPVSYPESDPRTWRTAEQWYFAAEQAALEEEQAAPPMDDGQRSAARLRSEIEQPPLPRDSLR